MTPEAFSVQLRRASWARHESVDPTSGGESQPGVLSALLDGSLHWDDFAAFTAQQYFVYQVLDEAAEQMRHDPVAEAFVWDELSRMAAFEADLTLLIGTDWRQRIAPLESTKRYVERLREVCFDWPGGYVAHHYTRYMGDLSGGQAFRAAAAETYGFDPNGAGVRFYIFDDIGDYQGFKDRYRARLDAAQWDAADKQCIIGEVVAAYDYNAAMLDEQAATMRRTV